LRGRAAANPLTQAVTPYEPYYKIQSSLLIRPLGRWIAGGRGLESRVVCRHGWADDSRNRKAWWNHSGAGPFAIRADGAGAAAAELDVLATLPGVQIVEGYIRAFTRMI